MSCLWKSVSTHLGSRAVTQTQVWESFEVEYTTNNKHDIQSRYVANTMAYTGELILMSCTYLPQDVHPRGDISLSEMLSHWCVWLANTLFLSCFSLSKSQSSVQCCFYTDGWRRFRLCTFYLVCFNVNEWCWKWDFWGLLQQQSKCHWEWECKQIAFTRYYRPPWLNLQRLFLHDIVLRQGNRALVLKTAGELRQIKIICWLEKYGTHFLFNKWKSKCSLLTSC